MDTSAHLLYLNASKHTHTLMEAHTTTPINTKTHTLTAGTYVATHLQTLTVVHIRISN